MKLTISSDRNGRHTQQFAANKNQNGRRQFEERSRAIAHMDEVSQACNWAVQRTQQLTPDSETPVSFSQELVSSLQNSNEVRAMRTTGWRGRHTADVAGASQLVNWELR